MIHDWLAERRRVDRSAASWRLVWPLASFEFRSLFRSRWGVVVFCLCLFPGLARLVMLLIIFGVVNFGPTRLREGLRNSGGIPGLDPASVDFYLQPVLSVMPGLVFLVVLTSLVVARTIARDRMANALELYWTRGISPLGYVVGKGLGSVLLIGCTTVAVPLALWVTAVFLAEDWSLLTDSCVDMLRATTGLLLMTIVWTGICLGISAICATPNTAMVAWCMLLVGTSALATVVSNTLDQPWLRSCLSLWDAGGVVVRAVAGVPQRGVSVPGAVATLSTTTFVVVLLARVRLRLGEAVR